MEIFSQGIVQRKDRCTGGISNALNVSESKATFCRIVVDSGYYEYGTVACLVGPGKGGFHF